MSYGQNKITDFLDFNQALSSYKNSSNGFKNRKNRTTFNEDYKSIDPGFSFSNNSWETPGLNFAPDGVGFYLGDINGDGKDDRVRIYTDQLDDRTETPDDLENRSLIFLGGNFSTTPNQIIYSRLLPTGDLNGDGFDDAVGLKEDLSWKIYFSDSQNLIEQERDFSDNDLELNASSVFGKHDLNDDGFGDVVSRPSKSGFGAVNIIFGAADVNDILIRRYENLASFAEIIVPVQVNSNAKLVAINFSHTGESSLLIEEYDFQEESTVLENTKSLVVPYDGLVIPTTFLTSSPVAVVDIASNGIDDIVISTRDPVQPFSQSTLIVSYDESSYSQASLIPIESSFVNNDRWIPLGDINNDTKVDFGRTDNNNLLIALDTSSFTGEGALVINIDAQFRFTNLNDFRTTEYSTFGDFDGDGKADFFTSYTRDDDFGQLYFAGNASTIQVSDIISYPESDFDRLPIFESALKLNDIDANGIEDYALFFADRVEIYNTGKFQSDPVFVLEFERIEQANSADLNGDGHSDLIINSIENPFDRRTKQIDVFFGGPEFDLISDRRITVLNSAAYKETDDIFFDILGDINNDGNEDFGVFSFTSTLRIYLGGTAISDEPDFTIDVYEQDYEVNGITTKNANAGFRLQKLGDINGDNIDDFAFGDIGRNNSNASTSIGTAGAVFIHFGSNFMKGSPADFSPDLIFLLDPEEYETYQYFGFDIESGDVNGDNFNDVVITPAFFGTLGDEVDDDYLFVYYGGPNIDNDIDQIISIPPEPFNLDDFFINSSGFEIIPDLNNDNSSEILITGLFNGGSGSNAILALGGDYLNEGDIPQLQLLAPNQSPLIGSLGVNNNNIYVHMQDAVMDFNNDGILEILLPQTQDLNYRNTSVFAYQLQDPAKNDQSINFPEILEIPRVGEEFQLLAMSTSGLEVVFELQSGDGVIENNVLVVNEVGEFLVRATQPGNNEFNPAPYVEQLMVVDEILSIDNKALHPGVSIFPNPNAGKTLYVSFGDIGHQESDVTIEAFDLLGRNYLKETFNQRSNNNISFDISSLKSGVYLIVLSTVDYSYTSRIIIE